MPHLSINFINEGSGRWAILFNISDWTCPKTSNCSINYTVKYCDNYNNCYAESKGPIAHIDNGGGSFGFSDFLFISSELFITEIQIDNFEVWCS